MGERQAQEMYYPSAADGYSQIITKMWRVFKVYHPRCITIFVIVDGITSHSARNVSKTISANWMSPLNFDALWEGMNENPSRSFVHFKHHLSIRNSMRWCPLQMVSHKWYIIWKSEFWGVKLLMVIECTLLKKYLLLWYVVMKTESGHFWSKNVTVAKRSSKA